MRNLPTHTAAAWLIALMLAAPLVDAQTLGGVVYAGGDFADRDDGAPVQAAGDLLDLPEAAARGTVQLLPRADLGPVHLQGELWGEALAAEQASPEWEGQIQRLTGEYSPGSGWLLSLGARVHHSGTAYVWNPSNPFTDPNVNNLDRTFPYHREGDLFAAAEWLGAEDSVIVQVVEWLPTDPLYGLDPDRQTSASLRWEHIFESADLAAVVARRDNENFAGLAGSMAVGERLELHAEAGLHERRWTLLPRSQTLVLPGGNATLSELAATDRDETVGQVLIGGQYTLPNLTNIIVEYFYNGEGYSDTEFRDLQTAVANAEQQVQDPFLGAAHRGFLADVAAVSGRMRRHYLFGRVAMPDLYKDLDLNLFLRWGLADSARVGGLLATVPLADGLDLRASLEHFSGPDDSEIAFVPFRWRGALALSLTF